MMHEEGWDLEYIENKVFLKKYGDRGRDKKDMKEFVLAGKPGPSSYGAGWKLPGKPSAGSTGGASGWKRKRKREDGQKGEGE